MASKLYGVNATIIIFVFVFCGIVPEKTPPTHAHPSKITFHSSPSSPPPSSTSEIAAMLGSSEDDAVVAGIQLSFILIQKLPSVFHVPFYKEGA